jgi:hypothetical protein
MRLQNWLIVSGVLVAMVVASALSRELGHDSHEPLALRADGIGPLSLGLEYDTAVVAARRAVPDSILAGPGCGDRDEVSYSGQVGRLPVTVMGMADDGVLTEIEMTLDFPRQAENETACLAQRDALTARFVELFGPGTDSWVVRKPVSSEHRLQVGPAVLVARWFPTGRSCYISALYADHGLLAGRVYAR